MIGQRIVSPKTYLLAWIAVEVLLLVSLGIAYLPLGPFNALLNYLIAVATALLVMSFFMHLKYASYLTKILAAAGFFWLFILIGISMADYVTRHGLIGFPRDFNHLYPGVVATQKQGTQPTGQLEKPTPISPASGQSKKKLLQETLARGKQVYKETCSRCHGTGLLGAPQKGNNLAWQARAKKGLDSLISHAVNGFKAMPPKGGNPKLSTNEIRSDIIYMLTESGIKLERLHP
jgi:cytochrome c oxidase subunit 4